MGAVFSKDGVECPVADGTGVLLLYTGSPSGPDPDSVAVYLREFLMDPCVLELPQWLRACLVRGVIVPLRARKSAAKYRRIWTPEGSPLSWHTAYFRDALQALLPKCPVAIGAAYGEHIIRKGLDLLVKAGVKHIIVFPLFPQYARATRGSLRLRLDNAIEQLSLGYVQVCEVPPFYEHPAYVKAVRQLAAPMLEHFKPEHVVFSYHGLPLRQALEPCDDGSGFNYEQQCLRSTAVLSEALRLDGNRYSQAYQSRFGRGWLTPSTESVLKALASEGKRRIALIAPSFVTDCLETLEELDIGARETFITSGGTDFLRIPALNEHVTWVQAAVCIVSETRLLLSQNNL